ncbi:MAG: hypothetical protein ACPGO7_00960 [Alphaproteobacteria bacterium]
MLLISSSPAAAQSPLTAPKIIRPYTVFIITAFLVFWNSTASAGIIELDDFKKPADGVEYKSSVELGRTIRNDAAIYLVFNATPKFELTHPTGFDIIGLVNSHGDIFSSLGESGGNVVGNGYWKFFRPTEGQLTNVKLVPYKSDLFVTRVNQVEQETFFWINPDLSQPEASQTPDASDGYAAKFNEISHVYFIGRANADLDYPKKMS